MARYNLSLPDELLEEIRKVAEENHTTVLEVLRKSIKLGLIAYAVQNKPGSALIIKEGERERQIVML